MTNKKYNNAIVLLSGGLDSTTCLAIADSLKYDEIHTISFDYGQKHKFELSLAENNSKFYKVKKHSIVQLDTNFFKSSALTDSNIEVPKNEMNTNEIPITYVPARNTVFLSYALAYAEINNCNKIYIGVNSIDYSGYPDCRPEFISAFEAMANLATKKSVSEGFKISIETPLINMSKSEIVKTGKSLGVDYSKTITCYDPIDNKACGRCDSCNLRKKGFEEAGIIDETIYNELKN